MIEWIFTGWAVSSVFVLVIALLVVAVWLPFHCLTSAGSHGYSEREATALFSRKTWAWLVPRWRVR